jgi:hypothetical protein
LNAISEQGKGAKVDAARFECITGPGRVMGELDEWLCDVVFRVRVEY